MRDHDCGCKTSWDDELNHPVYLKACGVHRRAVPDGWMVEAKKLKRETVAVS